MAKKKKKGVIPAPTKARPDQVKLTPEESLERMEAFPKRTEKFIALVRKGR
jgi:hypothetical protein